MNLPITMADILQLEQEAGQEANHQRLRAIVAERRVRELEAEVKTLKQQSDVEKS